MERLLNEVLNVELNNKLSESIISLKEDVKQTIDKFDIKRVEKAKSMMKESLTTYGTPKDAFRDDFKNVILVMKAIQWLDVVPDSGLSEGFTSLLIYWANTEKGAEEYKMYSMIGSAFKPNIQESIHDEIYQHLICREKLLRGETV